VRRVPFSRFVHPDSFSAVPRRRVPFSCLARRDSFLAVSRVSGPVFDGTEVVGSRFLVLRSHTSFRWHREWRVHFSCFALPDTFSVPSGVAGPFLIFCDPGLIFAVPGATCPVFMFYASGHVFDGTEGAGSCFHVLRSRTCFWRCGLRQVPISCFPLLLSCFERPYSF
jgi:hypothetical protein